MPLEPGVRLGPYEIAAQIGAGGMGEVYRATDTNLKRAVAIKVLPASVSGDPDRLARFQREAEVLAALNHPNIAAIYGLEKTPACTALVMELVEARGKRSFSGGVGAAVVGERVPDDQQTGTSGRRGRPADRRRSPRSAQADTVRAQELTASRRLCLSEKHGHFC